MILSHLLPPDSFCTVFSASFASLRF